MLLNQKTKDIITLFSFYALLYKSANYIYIGEPTKIPFTEVDQFWSFNPHWVWIYLSSFITLPLAYHLWFFKKRKDFLMSFGLLTVASFLIFVFFPTYIPRENYLPTDLNLVYQFVFKALHTADGVTNCLPSLHVSTAFFAAWWSYDIKRESFPLFFVYATMVAISTMTVKQHYFYDALAGFVLSLIIFGGWYLVKISREGTSPSRELNS